MAKMIPLLPLRIREQIRALQYKSELLVAAVQLAVIALLVVVNYSTPKGYSPGAPVHSAELGLSLFTILVLVRLWFAYTKQLSPFFLGFLVIAEMVLLLFILWTYYLQFETTPPINLKNTSFSFVFVLITLRALRFEPIWVILSGFTAAIGWCVIVWLAISSTSMNVLTWDYVTYASSRSVYLVAEFNKVLSILLVTGIIALVLKRGQELLSQEVTQTTAAKELARFFDTNVAEKITSSATVLQAGYGETRTAAILFTDLRGFTKSSQLLSPNDLMSLLGEYQRLLVPIIQKHHGTIDKFVGDGIMASFGAATPSDIYAANALHAVDEIIIAAKNWSDTRSKMKMIALNIGMGVAVGEVIFGVIGNEGRLEYTVIGEPVNLAAKLEKQNKVEHTIALTTPLTLAGALQQGYKGSANKERRPASIIADVAHPVDLVVLG